MTSFFLTVLQTSTVPCKALVLEGASGPEKTGLIAGLVSWLAAQGLRLAVVCSAPESDFGDTGKDTWKFRQAGANPVALAAPGVCQVTSACAGGPDMVLAQVWAALAPPADLVLVDRPDPGFISPEAGACPEGGDNPDAMALVASGRVTATIPVFEPHQVPELGRFILDRLHCGKYGNNIRPNEP